MTERVLGHGATCCGGACGMCTDTPAPAPAPEPAPMVAENVDHELEGDGV